jgi:hypothetical protein
MHQISKTLFCHKTLHVSGIFCARHQEFSTDRFLAESGCSNLTLLGSGHITCMKHTNCRLYSR